MQRIKTVLSAASAQLNPRAHYAYHVLWGEQRWSGADLRGKAKKWGANYEVQRNKARAALHAAGGAVIPAEKGRLVSAVYVGADDYGGAIYQTLDGVRTY